LADWTERIRTSLCWPVALEPALALARAGARLADERLAVYASGSPSAVDGRRLPVLARAARAGVGPQAWAAGMRVRNSYPPCVLACVDCAGNSRADANCEVMFADGGMAWGAATCDICTQHIDILDPGCPEPSVELPTSW
jgi:hypothetical protein